MSTKSTQITIGISEHWILGTLPLSGTRIQEILNDSNTHFVTISAAEIHAHTEHKCVAKLPEVVVPKSKIEFVIASSSEHEAPEKRWSNYTGKTVFQTFAILNDYRISGKLHLTTYPVDRAYALTQQLGRYFPLTESSLSGRGIQQLDIPLLLANRDCVSCFHIGDSVQIPQVGDSVETSPAELLASARAWVEEA